MAVKFNTQNIKLVSDSLKKFGITNPELIKGILVTSGKETGLNFISEFSYRNTPNKRIREVFGRRVGDLSDLELSELKKDNIAFFDLVYGGRMGNDQPGDGWKYRGRGPNQTTGKNAYEKLGLELGLDLVKNPDLLNDPKIGADVLAKFFKNVLNAGIATGAYKKFGVTKLSDITDPQTGTKVAVQSNAGLKTNFNNNVVQEGYKKALSYIDIVSPYVMTPAEAKKKLPRRIIIPGLVLLFAGGYYYWNYVR